MNTFDIAIIGTGPAGISAAINAKLRNKSVVLFGNENLDGKLRKAPKIKNYLGFSEISGNELADKFLEHIRSMDIEVTPKRVNAVYAMGDYFALEVFEDYINAKSVIICTGIDYKKPITGETEYIGKGVGYCATCDAHLYKGKTVAIVSDNEEFESDVRYTAQLAERVLYFPEYDSKADFADNVTVIGKKLKVVVGEGKVKGVIAADGQEYATDGVFFLRQSMGAARLVPGLEADESGHIIVGRDMSTNIKGLYAAGDCTGIPYQYMKAAGEGLIAAQMASLYVDKLK